MILKKKRDLGGRQGCVGLTFSGRVGLGSGWRKENWSSGSGRVNSDELEFNLNLEKKEVNTKFETMKNPF